MGRLGRRDRLIDTTAPRNIEQQIDAPALGTCQHFVRPAQRRSVIDADHRPHTFHGLQIFVTAGYGDHLRAECRGDLPSRTHLAPQVQVFSNDCKRVLRNFILTG